MTFSFHRGGVVMSSQITPEPWIVNSCALFFILPQLHHVTASTPLQVIIHQSTGEQSKRKQAGPKKMATLTQSYTYAPGLSTPSYLLLYLHCYLCCPKPPSHHPYFVILAKLKKIDLFKYYGRAFHYQQLWKY